MKKGVSSLPVSGGLGAVAVNQCRHVAGRKGESGRSTSTTALASPLSMADAAAERPPPAAAAATSSAEPQNGAESVVLEVAAPSGGDVSGAPEAAAAVPKQAHKVYAGEPEDEVSPPEISYLNLFLRFLQFGFLAFGGPVQQIAMMKEELVVKEKWVTQKRFQRVFGATSAGRRFPPP